MGPYDMRMGMGGIECEGRTYRVIAYGQKNEAQTALIADSLQISFDQRPSSQHAPSIEYMIAVG